MEQITSKAILFTCLLFASGAASSANAKSVECSEPVFDFGLVSPSGGALNHIFHLKNTGSDSITIVEIGLSCGCTTAEGSGRVIGPGKEWEFPIKFNMFGIVGPKRSDIKIALSNGEIVSLGVEATGDKKSSITPSAIDATVEVGGQFERKVLLLKRVSNDFSYNSSDFEAAIEGDGFQIQLVTAKNIPFQPAAEKENVTFLGLYEFKIGCQTLARGTMQGTARIKFRDGENFAIPLQLAITEKGKFSPSKVVAEGVKRGQPTSISLKVIGIRREELGNIEVDKQVVDINNVESVANGVSFRLPITWKENDAPKKEITAGIKGSEARMSCSVLALMVDK